MEKQKPKKVADWYTPARAALYERAHGLGLETWHSLLVQRQSLVAGKNLEYAGFETIEQDPLACRVAPVALHWPIQEQNPMEVLNLAETYRDEPWNSLVQQVRDDAKKDPRDVLLNRILGRSLRPQDIPTLHQIALWPPDPDSPTGERGREALGEASAVDTVYLSVDLGTPDHELVAGFQQWLRSEREKLAAVGIPSPDNAFGRARKKQRFTVSDMERWASMRVLDAIDINLACQHYDWPKPSAQQLGALLFPAEASIDTTDKVRQQVRPLAKRLLSEATLAAMLVQRQHQLPPRTTA